MTIEISFAFLQNATMNETTMNMMTKIDVLNNMITIATILIFKKKTINELMNNCKKMINETIKKLKNFFEK